MCSDKHTTCLVGVPWQWKKRSCMHIKTGGTCTFRYIRIHTTHGHVSVFSSTEVRLSVPCTWKLGFFFVLSTNSETKRIATTKTESETTCAQSTAASFDTSESKKTKRFAWKQNGLSEVPRPSGQVRCSFNHFIDIGSPCQTHPCSNLFPQ